MKRPSPFNLSNREYVAASRAVQRAHARVVLAQGNPEEAEAVRRLLHAQAWLGEASAGLLSPGIPRPKGKTGEGRSAPLVVRDLLRAELRIQVLEDALRWCGGSADFAPGGQAHKQWLNVSRLLGPERARAKR